MLKVFDIHFKYEFKVAIRVRPFNRREKELETKNVVKINGSQIALNRVNVNKKQENVFTFDSCFDSMDSSCDNFASQEMVFESIGYSILENAFKGWKLRVRSKNVKIHDNFSGYNTCIFAYGQTGSGKSYTMMGSQTDPGLNRSWNNKYLTFLP